MPEVDRSDLSEDLQYDIARLEVALEDLKFEANFYRAAALFTFIIMIERIWDRLFS